MIRSCRQHVNINEGKWKICKCKFFPKLLTNVVYSAPVTHVHYELKFQTYFWRNQGSVYTATIWLPPLAMTFRIIFLEAFFKKKRIIKIFICVQEMKASPLAMTNVIVWILNCVKYPFRLFASNYIENGRVFAFKIYVQFLKNNS